MLAPNGFSCSIQHNVFVCKANNSDGLAIYQQLQILVSRACAQMLKVRKDIPVGFAKLPADGVIGPILALATQRVIAALGLWVAVPTRLRLILSYQASEDEIIKRVATQADEIVGYINFVLLEKPDALVTRPATKAKKPLGSVIEAKVKTIGLVGATLASLSGLGYVAYRSSKRKKGLIDWADKLLGKGKAEEGDDNDEDEEDD